MYVRNKRFSLDSFFEYVFNKYVAKSFMKWTISFLTILDAVKFALASRKFFDAESSFWQTLI